MPTVPRAEVLPPPARHALDTRTMPSGDVLASLSEPHRRLVTSFVRLHAPAIQHSAGTVPAVKKVYRP
jgi:hypothetical protein